MNRTWWQRALGPSLCGPWTWRKAAATPLLVLIRCYQVLVSPLTPPSCRFYPSCSAYAVTALVRFGPLRGSWLAARRLGRCHPWNPGGVDHVPDRVTQAPVRDIPLRTTPTREATLVVPVPERHTSECRSAPTPT